MVSLSADFESRTSRAKQDRPGKQSVSVPHCHQIQSNLCTSSGGLVNVIRKQFQGIDSRCEDSKAGMQCSSIPRHSSLPRNSAPCSRQGAKSNVSDQMEHKPPPPCNFVQLSL